MTETRVPVAPAAGVRAVARVADVALPLPLRQTFAYRVPEKLASELRIGCRVTVPFGTRALAGFCVGFDPQDAPPELKAIRSVVDPEPLVDEEFLSLTRWLADRTLCSWGEALRAVLPGHASPRREKVLKLGAPVSNDLFGPASGASLEERILDAVGRAGELELRSLARSLGMRATDLKDEVKRLVRGKRLRMTERVVGKAPSGPPRIKIARLADALQATVPVGAPADPDPALERAPVQARCVELLREAGGEMPLRDLAAALAGSRAAVRRLVEKKLVSVTSEVWEGESSTSPSVHAWVPDLNPAQEKAVTRLSKALRSGEAGTFLLHGVTGSGKTEVYLRAMLDAKALGMRSILLVPEITLTPQTVSRLRGRFGGKAAVFHSRLTDAERRRIWHGARKGEYDVVLGPRSAVFTPLPDLGLIVIDEEHEGAYKQEDAPRYRAGDVAIERARRRNGTVLLGSATPDLETYTRAERGEIEILRLPERVSELPLPAVRLVDLRSTKGMFSGELLDAIGDRLEKKEQIILFLNRRGFSPFVQCIACGTAVRCSRCAVSLTYHRTDDTLRCHYCDHEEPLPAACPGATCRGKLTLRGAGTQRIEEELREHFPNLRLARLDSDSVRKAGAHEEILEKFLEGETDVLLGTQMVAKGLDFPRVTLVGVINADTGLHLPDYRAAERTFQVLAQVSGRAGRSELGGDVLIQTRCPDHPCLLAVRDHDDAAFRAGEIIQRNELRYPPFSRLASVLVRGERLDNVEKAAGAVRERIAEAVVDQPDWMVLLGPAPAPLAQLRGKHRYRLLLKGERSESVRRAAVRALEPLSGFPGVDVIVDVDPLDML